MYELIIIKCYEGFKNKAKEILPPPNSGYSRKHIMNDGDGGNGDSDGDDSNIVTRA